MTLEGPRLLSKVLVGSTVINDAVEPPSTAISSVTGSWATVDGMDLAAVQRSYFDLSGYNRDFLTTFVQSVAIQEPGPLTGTDQNNQLLEIISTEFMTDLNIAAFLAGDAFNGPGFSLSTDNMDQIVYARRRLYTQDQSVLPVIPKLWHSSTWGTAGAITSDKLHITRILLTSTPASDTFVSDCNVVIAAVISKEKELPFLMRQKRSYELATGP